MLASACQRCKHHDDSSSRLDLGFVTRRVSCPSIAGKEDALPGRQEPLEAFQQSATQCRVIFGAQTGECRTLRAWDTYERALARRPENERLQAHSSALCRILGFRHVKVCICQRPLGKLDMLLRNAAFAVAIHSHLWRLLLGEREGNMALACRNLLDGCGLCCRLPLMLMLDVVGLSLAWKALLPTLHTKRWCKFAVLERHPYPSFP